MENKEIKIKQEETLKNLEKFNEKRKTQITPDQFEKNVDERISVLEKRIKILEARMRKFEERSKLDDFGYHKFEHNSIRDDKELELVKKINEEDESVSLTDLVEAPEVPPKVHLCPYCNNIEYRGQVHGLGFCKEKPHYE